ncbi:MAG: NAD(P)-dependent glycerol-3-phosphate dehydrogenase [Oscillospiraceae bacterium]|jgi:glycerol-3-phosphate dehydrogenase (NAD(P)+)|nr:NAD(P)-dependent glycerol-3-phosphate dehydrogenase [Oscillospiraceae bacterium]
MKTTVLGSGGWGTAIAMLLNDNGYDIVLWSKFEDEAKALNETRKTPLLKEVIIPDEISITTDLSKAVNKASSVVIAVPSFALRETAEALVNKLDDDCIVICMSKGIEKDTSSLFTTILRDILGENIPIAAVSGPTHAEEVARKIPTACVAASEDITIAMRVQNLLMNEYMRVYTSTDVVGVELGAALKNVIALSAGIGSGLGLGDNTLAMLITRGLAEIAELCVKMGGRKETLAGLAGLGDLIVTCISLHSRNRKAGVFIGQGLSANEAMKKVGAVVEGYYAAKAAKDLADKMDVDMPICSEAYKVLYEQKSPHSAIADLMGRSRRSEQSSGGEIWVT